MSDNNCTFIVQTRSGSPAASVRVSTEVSGGISCIGGRTFSTDRNGAAYLKWSLWLLSKTGISQWHWL